MCGRFTLRTRLNLILQQFAIEQSDVDFEPRYNIAPTTSVPIVRQVGTKRELVKVKWGLIPSWSKEPKMSYSTINAKSEEVDKKPAFRSAIKSRRCLVVADGYYEWETINKKKFPHLLPTCATSPCLALLDCGSGGTRKNLPWSLARS